MLRTSVYSINSSTIFSLWFLSRDTVRVSFSIIVTTHGNINISCNNTNSNNDFYLRGTVEKEFRLKVYYIHLLYYLSVFSDNPFVMSLLTTSVFCDYL